MSNTSVMGEKIKVGRSERQPYADRVSWRLPTFTRDKNDPDIVLDDEGRKWHELQRKMYGPGQEMLSKMLKGIVSVPDVRHMRPNNRRNSITAGSAQRFQYFSSDIRRTVRPQEEKMRADIFVLKWIFKDSDRQHSHNVVYGGLNKAVQIDFEFFPIFFLEPNVYMPNGYRQDVFYQGRLRGHEPEHTPPVEMFDEKDLRHLTAKQEREVNRIIQKLIARFQGDDGKESLSKIVDSLDVPMREVMYSPFPENQSNEESFGLFYRTLLDRLHAANDILSEQR